MNNGPCNDREGICAPFRNISVSLYILPCFSLDYLHLSIAIPVKLLSFLIFEWIGSLLLVVVGVGQSRNEYAVCCLVSGAGVIDDRYSI